MEISKELVHRFSFHLRGAEAEQLPIPIFENLLWGFCTIEDMVVNGG